MSAGPTNDVRLPGTSGDGVCRVGFLLTPSFTLPALGIAIQPLRLANMVAERVLYSWHLISATPGTAISSDGIQVVTDYSTQDEPDLDLLIVVGCVDPVLRDTREEERWLKTMARRRIPLGAIDTGTWVLAHAGLLDGYQASSHWETLGPLKLDFPAIDINDRIFTMDRDRFTACSGNVPQHMLLTLIRMQHDDALFESVARLLVIDRLREADEVQRMPLQWPLRQNQPKLTRIVELMEANIEEPIELRELAGYAELSRRQMERLFLAHLGCSPSRYYMRLRLERARELLRQTALPMIEIAGLCGFVSTAHFSRSYHRLIGRTPREERYARALNLAAAAATPGSFGAVMSPNSTSRIPAVEIEAEPLPAVVAALARHAGQPGALLPVLHDVQEALGHLPDAAVAQIASGLRTTRAEVHGVITFYPDFHTAPQAACRIQVCMAEACQARGARATEAALQSEIQSNEHLSMRHIYCLGACATGPNLRISDAGGDRIVGRVDADRARSLARASASRVAAAPSGGD